MSKFPTETEELKDKLSDKGRRTVVTKNKDKGAAPQVDPEMFRSIIFSHNTAMFSIPSSIRDKARLVELYNQRLGAICSYNKEENSIVFSLGAERPLKVKKIKVTKKK